MNARILLLMLAVGLFMVAWNGDQAYRQEYLAQRLRQKSVSAVVSTGDDRRTIVRSLTEASVTRHVQTSISDNRHVVTQFRPDGMATGDYRGVSETGETFELRVDNSTNAAIREFYVADSPAGIRWYFVRINSTN
ncbi:MAG: hypothetical protein MK110_12760 [Fuerstiella sp.]|nr:hypothetical protein [Fuerstiella sp.]